jgi:diketogulonate reductase-like aldo/keto reductase
VGNGGEIADAEIDASGFIQQQQVAAIPKASSRAHLQANLSVFDFELTEEEMAQIFDLQGGLIDRVRSVLGL